MDGEQTDEQRKSDARDAAKPMLNAVPSKISFDSRGTKLPKVGFQVH